MEKVRLADEEEIRRAMLPEAVRMYIKYASLAQTPGIPEANRVTYKTEQLEILKVMKPNEVKALIDYGNFQTRLVQRTDSINLH